MNGSWFEQFMCRIALLRHSGVLKGEHLCTCCFSCSVNGIGINPPLIKRKCFSLQNSRLHKLITELSRFHKPNILARNVSFSCLMADFHSAFFCQARLFYCLNWIVFYLIPHGSSAETNEKVASDILRQKELNGYPPLRVLGWNTLKIYSILATESRFARKKSHSGKPALMRRYFSYTKSTFRQCKYTVETLDHNSVCTIMDFWFRFHKGISA